MQQPVHIWKSPLPDGSLCGEDISFAPEFEAVRTEVEKSESLHAVEGTDWTCVKLACSELLSTKSKDLWLLAYGIYASYQADGFDACPSAFACLNDLLETQWESLYPSAQRPQRRLAPFRWLHARMAHCAGDAGFALEAPEATMLLRAQFTRVDIFLGEKYGDDAPCFLSIFNATSVSIPDETSASTQEPSPTSSLGTPLAATLDRLDAEARVPSAVLPQLIRGVIEQTRQLGGHFLSLQVCDERAYWLHRTALWGTLLHLPPAGEHGRTQMSCGVPHEKIQAYSTALENKQYAELLPQLERSAAKAPYWLDGHYMVARCLEAMEATSALKCVRTALTLLLKRFPELLTYSFRDGIPFASPKVSPWLEALLQAPPQRALLESTYTDSGGQTEEEGLLQAALSLNAEQGFAAGLHLLERVPAGKSRAAITQGVLQARYCLSTGRKTAAQHLLTELYTHLEQWELLDWEPELSSEVLTLLLSISSRQRGHNEAWLRRLFWSDPYAAINLSPET